MSEGIVPIKIEEEEREELINEPKLLI